AMMIYSGGGAGTLANILVVIVVWRFATSVANSLQVEEEEKLKDENYLYGVERLEHLEIERKYSLGRNRYTAQEKNKDKPGNKKKKKKRFFSMDLDAHGNPSKSVGRLSVMAVIAFALGEPVLLSGPPEAGERALAAVIVFLLAAGVVLAAGSAAGTYRHSIDSGGKASLNIVPAKIVIAILLLVMVLAAGLTVPGIKYRGSGERQADKYSNASGSIKGKEENKSNSSELQLNN
ncbi:MAG: hypothetical protein GY940_36985, partial [bacterium]|nr:hypothetical protein [bacterium]